VAPARAPEGKSLVLWHGPSTDKKNAATARPREEKLPRGKRETSKDPRGSPQRKKEEGEPSLQKREKRKTAASPGKLFGPRTRVGFHLENPEQGGERCTGKGEQGGQAAESLRFIPHPSGKRGRRDLPNRPRRNHKKKKLTPSNPGLQQKNS